VSPILGGVGGFVRRRSARPRLDQLDPAMAIRVAPKGGNVEPDEIARRRARAKRRREATRPDQVAKAKRRRTVRRKRARGSR
jgi:hypothetical protein